MNISPTSTSFHHTESISSTCEHASDEISQEKPQASHGERWYHVGRGQNRLPGGRSTQKSEEQEKPPAVTLSEEEDPTNWSNSPSGPPQRWCHASTLTLPSHRPSALVQLRSTCTSLVLGTRLLHLSSPSTWSASAWSSHLGSTLRAVCRLFVNYLSVPAISSSTSDVRWRLTYRRSWSAVFWSDSLLLHPQANSGGTISTSGCPEFDFGPCSPTLSRRLWPTLGPLAGGFIAGSNVDSKRWQWIYWIFVHDFGCLDDAGGHHSEGIVCAVATQE